MGTNYFVDRYGIDLHEGQTVAIVNRYGNLCRGEITEFTPKKVWVRYISNRNLITPLFSFIIKYPKDIVSIDTLLR